MEKKRRKREKREKKVEICQNTATQNTQEKKITHPKLNTGKKMRMRSLTF